MGGCNFNITSWRAVTIAMFLSLAWVSSVSAQSGLLTATAPETKTQTSIEPFEDWQVVCNQEPDRKARCSMSISGMASAPDGRAVEIRLTQLPVKYRSNALFAIETPLDLLLSKGIEMQVDGGPLMRLAFRSCHKDGCLAPFSMNAKISSRFRKGQVLDIRLFELDGTPVEVRLSLQGFTAAGKRAGI